MTPGTGFPLRDRGPVGATGGGRGIVVAGVHTLSGPDDPLPGRFEAELSPRLAEAGLTPVMTLTTEHAANTFPRLPVRESETVLVWFAVCPDRTAADAALARARAEPRLGVLFDRPLQILRLEPTARSRLHG